jgi:hypothetical protein
MKIKNNQSENYTLDGFSDNEGYRLKISDELFFGDIENGEKDGLITIFDDYNFTIEESTPTDETIALDPELLGTVFENLIGMYNPETSESAKKATGSYYTPKDVVEYMCKESLKEVLKTKLPADFDINSLFDDKILDYSYQQKTKIIDSIISLKILDPACGSGAFPMGMLNLMIRIVEKLYDRKANTYNNKLRIIENCIYGIDIQNIAIEITKLRFFISILVDMGTNKTQTNCNVEVLPNLETKFVVANSLVELDMNLKNSKTKTTLFDKGLSEEYKALNEILKPYITAKDPTEKRNIKDNFERQKIIFIKNLKEKGATTSDIEKIKEWNLFNVCYCSPFFDMEIMFGIDGFDIVIGNPPYIQLHKMKDMMYIQDIKKGNSYSVYDATGDIYCLFYERGMQLLREGGHLCFITSNTWMRSGFGESLRKYLSSYNPKILIDLGSNVFKSATVDTNILLVQNRKVTNDQKTMCHIVKDRQKKLSDLTAQDGQQMQFRDKDAWVILSPLEQSIKNKIEKNGKPLKDWDIQINYGINTACNKAFIISKEKKDELISKDPKSSEVIKPILRGRDIKRYGYDFADLYLLYIPWHFPLHLDTTISGVSQKAEKVFQKQYPAIYQHLLSYKDILSKRNEDTCVRYEWYALHRWGAKYWEDFYKQKIVYPCIMTNEPCFTYDALQHFPPAPGNIITGNDLKYLLAFLCSKTCYFALRKYYMGGGIEGELKTNRLLILPVPSPKDVDVDIKNKIEILVDEMLIKRGNKENTDSLDEQIEEMVYRIYELSDKETQFISSSLKS